MSISTPAALAIIKQHELLYTDAGAARLLTIADNVHHMYCRGPAHSVVVYTCEAKITGRSSRFEWPIIPSVDGLPYVFRHHCRTGTGTSNLALTVEEWTGAAWVTLESASIAVGANTVATYAHTDTINASATKLRVTWSRVTGSHEFTPGSVAVYPLVSTIAAGKTAAGFIPQDDGLLSATGAPVHTEAFNRAARNAMVILQDRKQPALSFVQEDAYGALLYEPSGSSLGADEWVRMGAAWLSMPWQVDPTLDVYAIGSVSGGATADLIAVSQAGADGGIVTLNATGAVVHGTIKLDLDGGPLAGCVLEVLAKYTAGNETAVNAVCAYWTPGN